MIETFSRKRRHVSVIMDKTHPLYHQFERIQALSLSMLKELELDQLQAVNGMLLEMRGELLGAKIYLEALLRIPDTER